MIERGTDRIVGRVGLEHTTKFGHPEVELEWFIDPDAWGRGYATEMAEEAVRAAFTTLGLDSLIAYTATSNAASQAVMRKLGMTYERRRRERRPAARALPARARQGLDT